MCSVVHGTVHYKESLKAFSIVPTSGFPLSGYCHDCADKFKIDKFPNHCAVIMTGNIKPIYFIKLL